MEARVGGRAVTVLAAGRRFRLGAGTNVVAGSSRELRCRGLLVVWHRLAREANTRREKVGGAPDWLSRCGPGLRWELPWSRPGCCRG